MKYERFMKQWNAKCRLLTGLVLFLIGLIIQLLSDKTLDMYAFYMMSAAMMCVTNVLICKMVKGDADFILHVVLNLAILIVGFLLAESEMISGTVMYTAFAICLVADWVVNAILLPCDDLLKRIVMGFFDMLINVFFVAVVFIIPIMMKVFL